MRYDLAAQGAELTPDRPAIWFGDRWYRYGELNERATRLANRLHQLGIAPGERVSIFADNHLAHFDLLFAAAKHGFVLVAFNPRLGATELRDRYLTTRPALVLCDPGLLATCADAGVAHPVDLSAYPAWLERGERLAPPAPAHSGESTQMLAFTAGTSGRAKAVMIPYRQILANARGTAIAWHLGADDCAIQATSCAHASIHVLSTPLLAVGGRVILPRQFQPGDFLRLAESQKCSVMFMPPRMLRMLVDHPAFANTDLSALRWAVSGGAACPRGLALALAQQGVRLKQGYGLTEAGINCFALGHDEAAAHPDSVGWPLPHVLAEVRHADGRLCEADETGELTLSGEAVCTGYFDASDDWTQAFRQGVLWTGDLAERDDNGRFRIRGRREDVYFCEGRMIFPADVEAALSQCENVRNCAVIGVADAASGQAGVAAVALRPGAVADAVALRQELRQYLADHQLPSHFLWYESLPWTAAGNVDRDAIGRRFQAQADAS